jgi:hypothetical protein
VHDKPRELVVSTTTINTTTTNTNTTITAPITIEPQLHAHTSIELDHSPQAYLQSVTSS